MSNLIHVKKSKKGLSQFDYLSRNRYNDTFWRGFFIPIKLPFIKIDNKKDTKNAK